MLNIIGDIAPPSWMPLHGNINPKEGNFGLITLASNIIKLIMVVGGLFAFLNLIFAGLSFISSGGDPETIKKANSQIINSLVGLVVIAASFIIAAILGMLLFGNWKFILTPTISGVGI